MSFKSFLSQIRKQDASLPNLKVVGGPVLITVRVNVAFMPDAETTPRSIELRRSEDGSVHAVIWKIGKEAFSKIFKDEAKAQKFYDGLRQDLLKEAQEEAAEIKDKLESEFNQSWADAKTVYFHNGFRIQVFFSNNEEKAKINRQLLGLIKGACPYCSIPAVFNVKDAFEKFLQNVNDALERGIMGSHNGKIVEVGLPARSRCLNCLEYPNVSFTAQANKDLLEKLKKIGGELLERTET
jgi:hypothetical protein